jgi:two-component system nitrate/nitrite response regulator NarL
VKIVICDDHRLFLEAMALALEGRGFDVVAAVTTPDEAVCAVARHEPDLLLVDLNFPAGSGLDAARRVRDTHPGTTVVMITATEDPEPLAAAVELGVSGYLYKDQPITTIATALEVAGRGGLVVNHDLLRAARTTRIHHRQRRPLDALTPREHDVLAMLVDGLDTRQIVRRMGVSHSTVRTHIQNILSKLGVHSRLQAVAALAEEQALSSGGSRYVLAK